MFLLIAEEDRIGDSEFESWPEFAAIWPLFPAATATAEAALMSARIRHAGTQDLPAVVDIYNHYVEHSAATFDTRTFTTDEKRGWFDAYSADGPYRLLVADTGDAVIGYASSSRFKTRDAYRTSVETTIY
ncbi:MAG: hypothetical protein R3358_09845, partial [Woeseiaceae bacterium]|nr:hypothetical protein [Woeseiaceae bacterium]